MFAIVLSTAMKREMPEGECWKPFQGIVNLWKSNPKICRSILDDNEIPTRYKSTDGDDMINGVYYELEPQDYAALYQVCLDTPPMELDTEELHNVYRLVKKTAKEMIVKYKLVGLQVPNKRSHRAVWYYSRMSGAVPVESRVKTGSTGFVPFTHDLVVENLTVPKK